MYWGSSVRMPGALASHFDRVRASLLAKADEAGIARHGTLKGTARELLLADFLSANLPRGFDFVTGEIITPDDQRSGQVDVLIIPDYVPRFELCGRVCLACVHGVAAALEVKSTLTTSAADKRSELTKALDTVVGIKRLSIEPRLDPWPWSATHAGSKEPVTLPNIPVSIVAFDGPERETLISHLAFLENTGGRQLLPNTVTCLRRNYTICLNNGWLTTGDSGGQLYVEWKNPGSCLGDLFDHLMKVLQAWQHHHPATPLSSYLGGSSSAGSPGSGS